MVLRPWLGSLFLTSNPMLDQLTQMMRGYAPYKQTLEDQTGNLKCIAGAAILMAV